MSAVGERRGGQRVAGSAQLPSDRGRLELRRPALRPEMLTTLGRSPRSNQRDFRGRDYRGACRWHEPRACTARNRSFCARHGTFSCTCVLSRSWRLDVAAHAACAGAPVVRPADEVERVPHRHGGRIVTFWRYIEPHDPADARAAGRALRAVHVCDAIASSGAHRPAREALAAYGAHHGELVNALLPVYVGWATASMLTALARRPKLAQPIDARVRWRGGVRGRATQRVDGRVGLGASREQT
jgi:hypothetical protein